MPAADWIQDEERDTEPLEAGRLGPVGGGDSDNDNAGSDSDEALDAVGGRQDTNIRCMLL